MRIIVELDLSRYDVDTIKRLYLEGIISRDEFKAEVMRRGCHEWLAIELCRMIESKRAS